MASCPEVFWFFVFFLLLNVPIKWSGDLRNMDGHWIVFPFWIHCRAMQGFVGFDADRGKLVIPPSCTSGTYVQWPTAMKHEVFDLFDIATVDSVVTQTVPPCVAALLYRYFVNCAELKRQVYEGLDEMLSGGDNQDAICTKLCCTHCTVSLCATVH